MKRSEIKGGMEQKSDLHQGDVFDRRNIEGDDKLNETSRNRMFDNLQIALFFIRMQCQMDKHEPDL